MTDKELADRIVALGVGRANQIYPDGIGKFYQIDLDADWQTSVNEGKFVRDWRVAGALMEKCGGSFELCPSGKWQVRTFANIMGVHEKYNESLPRAIIVACVEALAEKNE